MGFPEPVFTKSTAATVTLWLAMYFTVAELRHVGNVTWRLYKEASKARSLRELEEAAEHFGRSAGASLLRVLVMIVGWGVGKALPPVTRGGGGGAMAMAGGGTVEGMSLATVEVLADGSLVATGVWLATGVKAAQQSVCGDGKTKDGSKRHHIATVRNRDAEVRGGPWTQRFETLFFRAGMTLEDPMNTVHLKGHYGPHPEAYHQEVYRRLNLALFGCPNTEVCRGRLVAELRRIAEEICNPGSMLNGL
ncbi:AHH domain-containing protein [Archangium sp.]|uniref:AHH domain-containing protein n=1 Tax=Archangium sp. TaxID=1872627 RepID=UPI00286CE45E|nr:AHH domain-containing protein [Archangium sp.]